MKPSLTGHSVAVTWDTRFHRRPSVLRYGFGASECSRLSAGRRISLIPARPAHPAVKSP
jgi:hypothetical protein